MKLAILASHPVQYQAPLFRELASRLDVRVFFTHNASPKDQADAGFGKGFEWDVDVLGGYEHDFLTNQSRHPGLSEFWGTHNPDVGAAIASMEPDCVLATGWLYRGLVEGIAAARLRGIPVMVRGDSQLATQRVLAKRTIKALSYPLLLRSFSAALYVGERSRQYWERYHYPRDRMFFSPHCVDNSWYATRASSVDRALHRTQLGIGVNDRVILFAGKLIPKKRPLDLVRACALAQSNLPLKLLIAGSGPMEAQVNVLSETLGVDLIQLGFCNQSEMPAAYACSDLIVLPSDAGETWGLVVNEALACGVPAVVSSSCGCAADFGTYRDVVEVFETGDVEALAAKIQSMTMQSPNAESVQDVAELYSVSRAADGVVQALEYLRG